MPRAAAKGPKKGRPRIVKEDITLPGHRSLTLGCAIEVKMPRDRPRPFWVAIYNGYEIRTRNIWIHVNWFYWPEETVRGLKNYHAEFELFVRFFAPSFFDLLELGLVVFQAELTRTHLQSSDHKVQGPTNVTHYSEDLDEDVEITNYFW
ncbi:hypothetical protein BDK51DRAFT_27887 [Blyttiomyces helicus]|uniref:BAH domain-containing protein n=1 Tax=Blyttiomyces helicus TaxID=388810 RepID=A0A4P9WCC9_9FUNG|nr:hypothetical protein BDK51DRAFT_27887 [Blyttiomyces helicus]|eukprot:RKO88006.1 hypothetical protein BDK51DRAFT_27887 [Blyttiomyces helicus]